MRVLVVDDSAAVRSLLTRILESDPGIEVCGTARDPYDAKKKIKQLNPDVLTLDVEMPNMDGITFLRNLMRLHPMPVVMISGFTERGAETTFQALESGAMGFVCKPRAGIEGHLEKFSEEIIGKLKQAVAAWRGPVDSNRKPIHNARADYSESAVVEGSDPGKYSYPQDSLIAIGASTGGTEAIRMLLQGLPADVPGIVIVQHIPEAFSRQFARRLNNACRQVVCEAEDGQQIQHGHVYIAPGNMHLSVDCISDEYRCSLSNGSRVNHHMPSVDVLFRSVARSAGAGAIGVLLSGMGKDGAQGMKVIREAGGRTIAQDEKSSVVWGMPGAACRLGAVDSILSIDKIPGEITSLLRAGCRPGKKVLAQDCK